MPVVAFLICFPVVAGVLMALIKNDKVRNVAAYVCAGVIMAAVGVLVVQWIDQGMTVIRLYEETETVDTIMLGVEIALMCFVTYLCFKYGRYWISVLSIAPTILLLWFEEAGRETKPLAHIYIDHLSILMCAIVGVIGGLIIIYSTGYMQHYHQHHKEARERKNYFFMLLFVFLGAMFGFVLSESLLWIDLFWEITSVCSFLLIGYTKTKEAVHNSFRALWMNLLGGTVLAIGIVYFGMQTGLVSFHELITQGVGGRSVAAVAVALIAIAALTKAAQLPFSTWLMGAMVAPTPSSALLHSATMVKAGVYVLIRLGPAMSYTMTGTMISLVGGFTFFVASVLAISQSDAKSVLALSTISNLGLMVACAGIGRPETIWAGVLLMIFHAISKSMLFQAVGATENTIGTRDIEDMHGLVHRLTGLAVIMFIGIAGMFLAPFGMLISKWSALKASVDTDNILMVLFIAFGSATTSFYWSKWMGKLISSSHETGEKMKDITRSDEWVSLIVHAVLMVTVCVMLPVISIGYVDPLLVEMFGSYTDVLPVSVMVMMVIIICFIFAVPLLTFLLNRNRPANVKLSYMSGINEGDNKSFVDSYGEPKRLWLSNYYFPDYIDERKVMRYCQIFALAVIVVMTVLIVGGVSL